MVSNGRIWRNDNKCRNLILIMKGINDIFIQNTSGIPYVARCYGGNYCQTEPDHELVTGFFAAINSFKGELGQSELNNVIYDKINLIFENQDDLLVVCNIDKDTDEEQFREIATKLMDKFLEIRNGPNKDYSEFISWMDEKVGNGMADLKPLIKSSKTGILGTIKSWFV